MRLMRPVSHSSLGGTLQNGSSRIGIGTGAAQRRRGPRRCRGDETSTDGTSPRTVTAPRFRAASREFYPGSSPRIPERRGLREMRTGQPPAFFGNPKRAHGRAHATAPRSTHSPRRVPPGLAAEFDPPRRQLARHDRARAGSRCLQGPRPANQRWRPNRNPRFTSSPVKGSRTSRRRRLFRTRTNLLDEPLDFGSGPGPLIPSGRGWLVPKPMIVDLARASIRSRRGTPKIRACGLDWPEARGTVTAR